jgi:hypothetical protein
VLPVRFGFAPEARAGGDKSRQVTICGIIAVPNSTAMDPKLAKIGPQLRKLLPNHGFKLLDVKSKPLHEGQSVACELQPGYTAEAMLEESRDENGKVKIRCMLLRETIPLNQTLVTTPANQLFFCDQELADGSHLLIGVGAR